MLIVGVGMHTEVIASGQLVSDIRGALPEKYNDDVLYSREVVRTGMMHGSPKH